MKTRYLIIIFALTGILLVTCNKKDNESTTVKETTPWEAGMTLTYSFIAGDDTVMKMRDEVKDYGYTDFPVLMLVHKETLIHKEGWGSVFHPLMRDKLDSILSLWATEFNMNYGTVQEKAFVARNFLDYIVNNDLDVGIFVDLALGGHGLKLANMIELVSLAEKYGAYPNEIMYKIESDKIPVEKIFSEPNSTKQGEVFCILFCLNVWKTVTNFVKIFTDNDTVNAPYNYMSYVCAQDTNLSHYTFNDSIASRNYHLSYDAGLWEAKCTYHVEVAYDAHCSSCSGQFIYTCIVNSTYCHVKGPKFIVDGGVSYSSPVNNGSPGNTIPAMNGQVRVTYGDCCCFRKFSVLNFVASGNEGYKETTWDTGK